MPVRETDRRPPRVPRHLAGGFGAALGALLMALWLTQCSDPAHAEPGKDRIVAAGGVITEILYALDASDRIVGVDSTSLHPPSALKDKPNVGYVRALSAEGVMSLNPSRIIATEGAGPPDVMRLIREAGIPVTMIPEDHSEEGVVSRINAVGAAAGLGAEARLLAAATAARFEKLSLLRRTVDRPKRVLFVLALRDGRPMVGGRNSSADGIIRLAGGLNAADAIEGYKAMSDEAVIAAAPDVILMMERGGQSPTAGDLFRLPAFSATSAAAGRKLVVMDGLYLLGFGPRTPLAARDLMAAIYPEKALPRLDEMQP
jgi:iron complex transport system substrate-binding protein